MAFNEAGPTPLLSGDSEPSSLNSMKPILTSIRMLVVLTLLTGAAYPLLVTGVAKIVSPGQAAGSIVERDGKAIGSALLAQKTENPRYFWPRPSAGDFATVSSAASNQGPTSAALVTAIAERKTRFGENAPAELLTASGSGLDPHLSPAAAEFQAARIAHVRGLSVDAVKTLIVQTTEGPQFGFLGEPRVNVLSLNLALDRIP
jgi:potassium-transporting ATPase KdpC subunit